MQQITWQRLARALDPRKQQAEEMSEEEQERQCNRERLYGLLCFVTQEIDRNEQLFNLVEEDAMVDNVIYTLKSLRAQQQYLVQNLRRLEGVGKQAAKTVENDASGNDSLSCREGSAPAREGFAMG